MAFITPYNLHSIDPNQQRVTRVVSITCRSNMLYYCFVLGSNYFKQDKAPGEYAG